MINWNNIDTVLLDMDGTLLDLNFDNHFWQSHVPLRYSEKHDISFEHAYDKLMPIFKEVEGTIDWYCVDYWTERLELDIARLKSEVAHLIDVHPYVLEFLDSLRKNNIRSILVTNAHQKSLALKLHHTQIDAHLDKIICAHDYRTPKEEQSFWDKLKSEINFDNANTLLIDDSLSVLRSAKTYGIEHLLAVYNPDSQQPTREIEGFNAIYSFKDIMP